MSYNPFSLAGKTILVTGASSGIGRAIAVECSRMGATVIITARNEERLSKTLSLMSGGEHKLLCADLCNEADMENLCNSVPDLDGLVNCAGIVHTLPFQFINREALHELMDVNFTAPVLLSARLVKRKSLRKGASVVYISSISGKYCTSPANSMYTASKAGIDGIAKGMALDLAPKGIRVNCINPGMIETDIFKSGVLTDEQLQADRQRYPLKRYGRPEEIAYAAVYLLSDASCWMTGGNILIDGGYTLQ